MTRPAVHDARRAARTALLRAAFARLRLSGGRGLVLRRVAQRVAALPRRGRPKALDPIMGSGAVFMPPPLRELSHLGLGVAGGGGGGPGPDGVLAIA